MTRLTAAGLCAGMLLSPKLWLGTRFYPLTPVCRALDYLARSSGHPIDYVLYGTMIGFLGSTALSRETRVPIFAFAPLALSLAILDQSRWQPWFYQYLFMLVTLGLSRGESGLNVCRLIVAATYFWSGLQKMNGRFAGDVFDWMLLPIMRQAPGAKDWLHWVGFAAPAIEALIGVGLLTGRCSRVFVCAAVGTHAMVLAAIGPWGHNWNTVVWPWNLAMAGFVLVLFGSERRVRWKDVLWSRAPMHLLALALFGVAPGLSFFNLWDDYLSAALYAGNKNRATIYMTDSVLARLPETIQESVTAGDSGANELDISDWSFAELNVPAYPEARVFKNAARRLCLYALAPADVKVVVEGKAALFHAGERREYDCGTLRQ